MTKQHTAKNVFHKSLWITVTVAGLKNYRLLTDGGDVQLDLLVSLEVMHRHYCILDR